MARHILHRLLLTLPALWLVLTMVFFLIHIVPGDPVEQMLGEGATPIQAAQLRHTLGLDQPLYIQYVHYLGQTLRGDLGESFKFQAPVRHVIFERYPATLQLAFLALLVCAAIALPAGIIAAHKRGSTADRSIGVFTLFGLAVPNFALGPEEQAYRAMRTLPPFMARSTSARVAMLVSPGVVMASAPWATPHWTA